MFSQIKWWFCPRPTQQCRGLLLGLDSAGKSSLLYKLGGQVVTTIPTIGLNLETLSNPKWKLTSWDVGGCDKNRHLWVKYIVDVDFLLYVHDCSDRDRLVESLEELSIIAKSLSETASRHVFILLNKQDMIQKAAIDTTLKELSAKFIKQLEPFKESIHVHVLAAQGLNCRTGHRLDTAMTEVRNILMGRTSQKKQTDTPEKLDLAGQPLPVVPPTTEQLIMRINDEGTAADDHDRFWQDFKNAHLKSWGHYAHLRAGYFMLLDQQSAGSSIFECADRFIAQLNRLRATHPDRFGNTSHKTITVFWLAQLRGAALEYSAETYATKDFPSREEFQEILLQSPHLMNSGLWRDYYSKEVLFTQEARQVWCPPDLHPLTVVGEERL